MKRKNILLILALFLLPVIFSACKKEDEPQGNTEVTQEEVKVEYIMPEGTPDEFLSGELYIKERANNGVTLLAELHDKENPRIVEVNMRGEILWEYKLPDNLKEFINPGLDVEYTSDDTIIFLLPRKGVYEINRNGDNIWTYDDPRVSNDADRLENGNTLVVWGGNDEKEDAQVKEVNKEGEVVWEWYAKDHFDKEPYNEISDQGWTHCNSAERLSNGNTLISLRNFNKTIEVDSEGNIVWEHDWTKYGEDVDPYSPQITGDNILVALQNDSQFQAVEINKENKEPVWEYTFPGLRSVRDAKRLANGNTLLTGVLSKSEESVIIEVTPRNEVVWLLRLKDISSEDTPGFFYSAKRK